MEKNSKKYYTLNGLDALYENYSDANQDTNKKAYKNKYPLGFESKEEAEMLRSGHWDEYFQKVFKSYETEADAVVYTDGSFDSKKEYAAYGLIIFFRTGEVYCESAKLEDDENLKNYRIQRYDVKNNEIKIEYGKGNEKNDMIKSARQYAGECAGVMRGLDICCKEKKLKKIVVVYDCKSINQGYNNAKDEKQSSIDKEKGGDMAKRYSNFCEDLYKKEKPEVKFFKVDSHIAEYRIGSEEFSNAIYNDVVDILAKAETTEIPLKRAENFNLVRAMSECDFETFGDVNAKSVEERRSHARAMFLSVVKSIYPVFK